MRTLEHVSWNYLNKKTDAADLRLQLAAALVDKETTNDTVLHRLAELIAYSKPSSGEG